jgi:GH24 family phage-related lysozyme (muramidase)
MDKFSNIYIGLVVNNKDPKNRGRVQVFVPHITNTLYQNWNNKTEDIRFRTLDSSIFNPEITQRLIDVLPWSDVAMPFFGGGTGAPINQSTNEPTPIPTESVVSAPGEYMVSSGSSTSSGGSYSNYIDNILKGSNGGTTKLNIENEKGGTADSRFLNQEFARRLNGLHSDLTARGYTVKLTSAFRAPTETIKKQIGSIGTSQEVLFNQTPDPRKVARPFRSQHDSGIAADLKVYGGDGKINIQTISYDNNSKNKFGSEYEALLAKWGLHQSVPNEAWHLAPIETKGRSKEEAAALLTANYNANPNLDGASPSSSSSVAAIPKKDGLNNRLAEVTDNVQNNTNSGSLYSNNLLTFIKEKEGYSAKAYDDGPQYSIGYGTVAKSPNETIDKNEAESRLKNEIDQAANLTNKALAKRGITNLTQSQKEALMSFTYNLGPGNPSGPVDKAGGLRQLLDSEGGRKDWKTISEAMPLYNKAGEGKDKKVLGGLTDRRNAEVYYANTNGQGGYVPDNSNKDPQKLNMITSSFQNVNAGDKTVGMSGGGMGMFSVPHIGSKAYVMFLDGNPMKPIVVGCYQEPSNA